MAAQVDFSEPGELGLFIDESQSPTCRSRTASAATPGEAMAGSFQFLHSRDPVWTRRMREYLMGEREQPSDLMAWNSDTTRMPARMHHEYLVSLYLHNALAMAPTASAGTTARRSRSPICTCRSSWSAPRATTSRPGRSVYKLHHL